MTGGEFKLWALLWFLFVILPAFGISFLRVFLDPEKDEAAAGLRSGPVGKFQDILQSVGYFVVCALFSWGWFLWNRWDNKKAMAFMLGEAFVSAFFVSLYALAVLLLAAFFGIWLKPKWPRMTFGLQVVTFIGAGVAVSFLQSFLPSS